MAIVVTDAGKAIVTNRIKGAGSEPNYIGWGTGAGTATEADTTLFAEAAEARVAGTSTREQTTTANDTYRVVGSLVAVAARAITNAGLFDASAAGNLFVKGDFAVINLAAGESIEFTFDVVVDNA